MTEIRLITSNLIGEIKGLTQKAENLYWIVAFAMESGVRLVLPYLKEAAANGAEIKILIGDYLHITQPEAFELLVTELPNAEIRLFESRGVSFHPKAYLFRTAQDANVIIGSSNLSKSAMTHGIEWSLYAIRVNLRKKDSYSSKDGIDNYHSKKEESAMKNKHSIFLLKQLFDFLSPNRTF